MRVKLLQLVVVLVLVSRFAVSAATFGTVVPIGGNAADIALDEPRGVLYVANFTANRIEVVSLSGKRVQTSINVPPQPGSLALSPDGRFLVVAHFANYAAPATPANALTVIDLNNYNAKQTFALSNPPLGVAFGYDGYALVVTSSEFLQFDPLIGTLRLLQTISDVTANSLPMAPANFPPQIITASLNVSGDGTQIYGLTDTLNFRYDVTKQSLRVLSYVSQPPQGPRVVSVNQDGTRYVSGWALADSRGSMLAQFLNPVGLLNIGGHAIDSGRGLVYAQLPEPVASSSGSSTGTGSASAGKSGNGRYGPPVLRVMDLDNLNVRERIKLPENLAGKSLMSSDSSTMYSVSDSGVLVLPVGSLDQMHRVSAGAEDLVFRGNACDRSVNTQQLLIYDPGDGQTDFRLSSSISGITFSPSSGTTPAVINVMVDPAAFQNQKGTVAADITITSASAINQPKSVRALINMRDPDQRGTVVDVPGKLVDVLADPARNRFYVLRQDTNQVLVFSGDNYTQIATLRTGNTPTQMAITFDRHYLLVGADNSQIIQVFDLDTLQPSDYIRMPFGHYPRSIGISGSAILVANRVAGPKHTIDRVNMSTRTATELPSLGVWTNDINVNTVLQGSPNGASILAAGADGSLFLYSANAGTFTVSRKDYTGLQGAYAASSYNQYVVDNHLLNSSLVEVNQFQTTTGDSSGFAFVDFGGYRTTTPGASNPGVIEQVDLSTGDTVRPTRIAESALIGDTTFAFTRTLAPLANRTAIISLTTSGFTVLPWNYDASVAPPRIDSVVNAADGSTALAPGGLISITGSNLSPVNAVTQQMPLPAALAESCLMVNGLPAPMIFASNTLINAQLPFQVEGEVTMVLSTPGGISDNFNLVLMPSAPAIFHNGAAGDVSGLATVVRAKNGQYVTMSNPIHRNDNITIYLTGLGQTSPSVAAGVPAPADPKASVLVPPDVTLGGAGVPVSFAGLAPGQVGVYQIDAKVSGWAPTGLAIPLTITQASGSTTINVRVVE